MKKFNLNQKGQVLITLIIVVPSLILIASAYLTLITSSYRLSRQDQFHTHAQLAADAGADYAISQLNQDNSWTGTAGDTTIHNDGSIKDTFGVTTTSTTSTQKVLQVIGKSYWPANSTAPSASVTINITLNAVSTGSYSIVSGEGGLVMNNNSKIVAGSVLINGTVNLSNNAQIGLSTRSVTVSVADQACPTSTSDPNFNTQYPRVCTSSDSPPSPISINNNARIYGTVSANNQSSGTGMSNPGLVANSGVEPQALPTYNRAAQKSAVTTTINSGFSCNNGNQTWAANTKIVGNASISGSCKVTVNGNVWITGNLTVSNNAQLIVSNSLGSTVPNIMVDGSSGLLLQNNSALTSNSSNTGFEIYTFWSAGSCSPDCTSLVGTNLYNSQNITTISMINNSNAGTSIFYAYWSRVSIQNAGTIGAVIGQSVLVSNNGTLTFGNSVQTGSVTWVPIGYRRSF